MVLDVYRREWTPFGEQQLARKVKDKGGVKYVENSDNALSELAGIDDPGSEKKVFAGPSLSQCISLYSLGQDNRWSRCDFARSLSQRISFNSTRPEGRIT
jgi:hypothetical protein